MAGNYGGIGPVQFNTPSMVTATLNVNDGAVGGLYENNGNIYRLVYNAGASVIPPGTAATVSAVSGWSVTVSTTVSSLVAVGVCLHASIPAASYGYLLVKGFGNYKAAADSIVGAGEGLCVADAGRWVVSSGITGTAYGKAMIATASGGLATGYFSFY